MQVLAGDVSGLSNGDFADRVTQAFGQSPQQHAKLYSSDEARALGLLQRLPARWRAVSPKWISAHERARLAADQTKARTSEN
jgi:hypothetical protein